jgi:adenosylcobinamide-phosphate synthase
LQPELAHLLPALALLLALVIDRWWGEPSAHWHPVVWMGHYLGWAGCWVAPAASLTSELPDTPDYLCFLRGTLMWLVGASVVVLTAGWLQQGLLRLPELLGLLPGSLLAVLGLGLALKPMLAWAMLKSEVLAVEVALNPVCGGSLAGGRARLRWLVSRDVTQLTESEVRESAMESLAENLNDSVVAPLFWFVLLGLPGAALYRFANTADAMWGYPDDYQGRYWQWAGKWAARADDVLSWLPARLTALLLAVVAGGLSLRRLTIEAARTPSPNSGWPMAALALALKVRLQKPGVYVLNTDGRAPLPADMQRALRLAFHAVGVLALLTCIWVIWTLLRGIPP